MPTNWTITRRFGVLIALIFLLFAIYFLRGLFGPLLVAAVIAYVLNPIVTFTKTRLKLPHRLAVVVVYSLFLTLAVTLPAFFAPVIVQQLSEVSFTQEDIEAQFGISLSQPLELGPVNIPVNELASLLETNSSELLNPERIFRVLSTTTTNLAWVLIILATIFYLLLDWVRLRNWLLDLAPPSEKESLWELYNKIAGIWVSYLKGQLTLMLVIATVTGFASFAVGLRGGLILGLIAGIFDALPTAGPILAMAIAVFVAWLEGSSWLPVSNTVFALIVLGIYGLIQLLENVYFRPRIMKSALQLHPAIVIVAIIGSIELAGILVTLIIIPLVSSAMAIISYFYVRVAPRESRQEIVNVAIGDSSTRKL